MVTSATAENSPPAPAAAAGWSRPVLSTSIESMTRSTARKLSGWEHRDNFKLVEGEPAGGRKLPVPAGPIIESPPEGGASAVILRSAHTAVTSNRHVLKLAPLHVPVHERHIPPSRHITLQMSRKVGFGIASKNRGVVVTAGVFLGGIMLAGFRDGRAGN